jgi:hypothetical protein
MARYFIWIKPFPSKTVPNAVLVDKLGDGDLPSHKAANGVEVQANEPWTLLQSDDLGGLKFYEVVANTLGLYIVSQKTRALLEEHAEAPFEFIPARIMDRKNRPIPNPYFIANLIGRQVDCVDTGKSVMEEKVFRKGTYNNIKCLYLRHNEIDPNFKIFRLMQVPKVIAVREDLKDILEKNGVTGHLFYAEGDKIHIP